MKPLVYLDTTFPSYLFDERESIALHIDVTKRWWKEESLKYEVWASEETVNEIADGTYPRKEEILKFIGKSGTREIRDKGNQGQTTFNSVAAPIG